MFFHSSSYTANPIACAAAGANLEIWRSEPVLERITGLAESQTRIIATLASDKRFRTARQLGTIAAFDLIDDETGSLSNITLQLRAACVKRGVLLRPLGNTIYIMPPYCTTSSDLDLAYAAIYDAVDEVHT